MGKGKNPNYFLFLIYAIKIFTLSSHCVIFASFELKASRVVSLLIGFQDISSPSQLLNITWEIKWNCLLTLLFLGA